MERIEKSNFGVEWSGDYVTEEIFCLLLKQGQERDKKLEVQLFLVRLLAPLSFTDLPRFCLVLKASILIVGLAVGLAIGGAKSIGKKIAVSLSGWSWWKVLISLQRCNIAKAGFEVFFSLG